MSLDYKFGFACALLFPVFWGFGEIALSKSCTLAVLTELLATIFVAMLAAILLSRSDEGSKQSETSHSTPTENSPYEFSTGKKIAAVNTNTKSLELAADNIKQFLTLTTAILAVTSAMVVANRYIESSAWYVKSCFFYAWLCQAVSIFFGVFGHMKVIGLVHFLERGEGGDVYDSFLTYCMQKQQVFFGLGLLFTVICAIFIMVSAPNTKVGSQDTAFPNL
jgi:hypothetical protein